MFNNNNDMIIIYISSVCFGYIYIYHKYITVCHILGGGGIHYVDRNITMLSFGWSLSSNSDPAECSIIETCITPTVSPCQNHTKHTDISTFTGLIPGVSYVATLHVLSKAGNDDDEQDNGTTSNYYFVICYTWY